MLNYNSSKRNFTKKTLTINDIPKDIYLSMFAIRVYFMEFAIDHQLKAEDNFKGADITKCKDLFHKLGFIHTSSYSSLNELYRECIYLTNPNIDRIDKINPITYRRTLTFKNLFETQLKNLIFDNFKDHEPLLIFYNSLEKKFKSYEFIKSQKLKEERELDHREVKNPSGNNYFKPTVKKRNKELLFFQVRAEFLLENPDRCITDRDLKLLEVQTNKENDLKLLLHNTSSNQLVVREDKKNVLTEYKEELINIYDNFKRMNRPDTIHKSNVDEDIKSIKKNKLNDESDEGIDKEADRIDKQKVKDIKEINKEESKKTIQDSFMEETTTLEDVFANFGADTRNVTNKELREIDLKDIDLKRLEYEDKDKLYLKKQMKQGNKDQQKKARKMFEKNYGAVEE